MKVRIITALVAIAGIFPFFWFSDAANVFPVNYLFPLLIAAIAFVSVFELLRCVGLEKNYFLIVYHSTFFGKVKHNPLQEE